jgi:DNA (cytosine-5)-methyltransferase 1
LGRSPDIAINHDKEAISMHRANHPNTKHYIEDVWKVDPKKACAGRPVGLMWLSPDCRHFSKAKGGKPRNKKIRGLAWIAVHWAKAVRPRVICLENVEEFQKWGPLLADGTPCKERVGQTYRKFVRKLEALGYAVEARELVAADYGVPTSRRRLFLVARCDGQPIRWPLASHGKGRAPYRTAAECISWEIPCPSIFERKKDLAPNTQRRIARGIRKYVVDSPEPFIVPVAHAGDSRAHSIDEPMRTITGAHRGEHALVRPFIVNNLSNNVPRSTEEPLATVLTGGHKALVTPMLSAFYGDKGASSDRCQDIRRPLPTQTADPRFALVAPTLIQTGYGERPGQAPRVPGLHKPLGTVVDGQKHGLVTAFLAKHYGGHETPGSALPKPIDTITAQDHHAIVASSLVKLRGTCRDGQAIDKPLGTVSAQGNHFAEVRAFLMKYHRDGGQLAAIKEPMPTIPCNDNLGLVTVRGLLHAIVDIGMRMLQPRELFRAHGFPETYQIDTGADGERMTKEAQVRMCGNSVPPDVAAAVLTANFIEQEVEAAA